MRSACLRCGATDAVVIAETSDRLYGTTKERFRIVKCQDCGMARLSPQPDAEALGRYYPANYWFAADESRASKLAESYRRLVLRDHAGFVAQAFRHAGGAGPVLDVGCGGGLLPGILRERGMAAFGLDSSRDACGIAWHRHHVPTVAGELAASAFAPSSFTLVSMFHVLEHLPDPASYLGAARALLSANGRLVVQVPNLDSWQFRVFGQRWNGLDVPRHLNNFRAADLRFLLEKYGFAVVRTKHFSLRDNPAGMATSLAPGLDPMARRIRGLPSNAAHLAAYLALTVGALPFALIEAAFGHGSSVMMEARKT